MTSFSDDDRSTDAPGELSRWVLGLIAVAWGIAWAFWLDGSLVLLLLGSIAVAALAVALRVWRPRALDDVADRRPALAWMLPRLVLVVVALLAVAGASPTSPPLPDCPPTAPVEDSDQLLYADLVDDTLVCIYQYTGNAL